jgi:predicted NBD/HSP70 family sugar kinase
METSLRKNLTLYPSKIYLVGYNYKRYTAARLHMSSPKSLAAPLAPRIRTATPASVRQVNRSIILELIRRRQPVSRAELARATGIFRSSISDIVDELVADGLVLEERSSPSGRGRVPMSLTLNDASQPVLGLNIRPRQCQLAYAGLSGRIQKTWTFETPSSPKQLIQAIAKTVRRARDELPRGSIRQMGIAIPGHVDAARGTILWTPTHLELAGFPIAAEIERALGIRALADNDCNVGALSELWLATEDRRDRSSDFVFLNISDFGVGAGAVLTGEIYLGHDARLVAEVGHMVIEPDGLLCRCGRHGCWELYACNEATWKRFDPETPFTVERFEMMLAAAGDGNRRALNALRKSATYLSLGISNIGFLFNPAEVVVAGRIVAVWDLVKDTLNSAYASAQLKYSLRPAKLPADNSLLHGAVCLALRETFAAPKFGEA